ncbi:hypothetical protein [Aphanizomenon sp. UHCC 0183]|uniref:hypothetical protein n=1 Tax=Aphanizomenon sp. UHCC 0183 TaxID=2590028 RepID=UPI0020C2934C|nr:hypothetical protein [Aphanizomenon sp. UHCC 0183]
MDISKMTQLSSHYQPRRGRVFPEKQISYEEKTRRNAEYSLFYQGCRVIFNKVQPELIQDHYDWFIVIEPVSGNYVIDPDETIARQKAREKFGTTMRLMMRINEIGNCGKI